MQDFHAGRIAFDQVRGGGVFVRRAGRHDHGDFVAPAAQSGIDAKRQRSRARDDDVVFSHGGGESAFDEPFQIAADYRAGNRADGRGEYGNAKNDNRRGEQPGRDAVRRDVAIAHRGHGHDGEVERGAHVLHRRVEFVAQVQRAEDRVDQQRQHADQCKQRTRRDARAVKAPPIDDQRNQQHQRVHAQPRAPGLAKNRKGADTDQQHQ
ncbi:hypothetical protein D3C72_1343710 [compost metagenome]